jgi:hypothetical protein
MVAKVDDILIIIDENLGICYTCNNFPGGLH